MASPSYRPTPSRKAALDQNAKVAKLRELRLARDAASREAGTQGDISVGQLMHEPTGDVFVLMWKGQIWPDLATLHRSRLPLLSIAERGRLQDWLAGRDEAEFKQSFVSWNMSRGAAKRAWQLRIAELRANGRGVLNDNPGAS